MDVNAFTSLSSEHTHLKEPGLRTVLLLLVLMTLKPWEE